MERGGHDPGGLRPAEKILYGIGCVVTAVWTIAVLVPLIFPSRQVSPQVHIVMLTVATACFALGGVKQIKRNGNGGA